MSYVRTIVLSADLQRKGSAVPRAEIGQAAKLLGVKESLRFPSDLPTAARHLACLISYWEIYPVSSLVL